MLDTEQNDQQDTADSSSPESGDQTPPRARRRRAATRPAGPPIVVAAVEDPTGPPSVPAAPTDPAAAEPAPAKKTAKRAPRKKAAASAETTAARTPRKRTATKAAAAPVAEPEPAKPAATQDQVSDHVALPPAEPPSVDETLLPTDHSPAPAEVVPAVEEPVNADQIQLAEKVPVAEDGPGTDVPGAGGRSGEHRSTSGDAPVEDQAGDPNAQSDRVDESADTSDSDHADDDDGSDESDESDESDDTEDTDESDSDAADGSPTRRRRRRRGGRRRRRGAGGESTGEGSNDADDETDGEDPGNGHADNGEVEAAAERPEGALDEAEDDGADEPSSGDGDGQRRRRRRRRRRGEDSGGSADDPAEVVVRVREPANRRKSSDQPAGIEGSTRLEAKRQRRREGREAGRRRAPILSEAEFLARRESVERTMVIRQREDTSTDSGGTLTQIAVLEDNILVEHYVDRDSAASLIGNVYLGRVQNVLPSMEAAFIDIGRGRNAVLYAGEVDWESFGAEGQARKVEKVLKSGQTVLVQVTKDPVGAKGARLTNHVSIPGRYIVYAPGGHLSGISRKLPDTERRRLKDVLADLVPESASVIVRTAAEGASEEELVRDVNRLKAQWEDIERKIKAGQSPQLLYAEPDLTLRIVRDLFTEDFGELVVSGNNGPRDSYDAIEGYVAHVAPHLAERLKRWAPESGEDVFAAHRIDEQIAKALERKVFLPSGGSLVMDRTEAMTVIDVNTGKFTGTGGNLEATVTSNNLEAAEELVRQLRLRDIGGIIVIDFIDMVLPSNRELLLRRLVECLGRDRTRHQVAEVTSLGLVQMTRKKIGTGLLEAFSTECEVCHGRGYEIHDVPVESQRQADGGARDRGRQRPSRRGGGRSGSSGSSGSGTNGGEHQQNIGSDQKTAEHQAPAPTPVG